MRVIRTEMYFGPSDVKYSLNKYEKNPGVAAAWLTVADAEPPSVEDLFSILDKNHVRVHPKDLTEIFAIFADLAVQNVKSSEAEDALSKRLWQTANPGIVDFLFNSEIVLESSPPYTEALSKIGKGGAAVAIGTFIGYGVADGNYPLMFLTIPLGIIVVGSAIGVSRGLENGLNDFIQRLFKGKHKRLKGK